MTRQENIQILTLLSMNFDNWSKKTETDEQVEMMISNLQEFLGDLDYNLVLQAVKKTIIESSYPPTIAEIRKNAVEIVNPTKYNPLEDWNECYKMICSGAYMTQEEFNSHSEICRKFLGSLSQLKAYATNADFNLDVVRSNFLKQYENLKQREKQQKLLPLQMQEMIGKLAENMDIKQIEGGNLDGI